MMKKLSFKFFSVYLAVLLLALWFCAFFLLSAENGIDQYGFFVLITVGLAVLLICSAAGYAIFKRLLRLSKAEQMSEEEEMFRLAVEGTEDGIFDWNVKTGEIYYSVQFTRMLGHEQRELAGNLDDFLTRLHPEEKQAVWNYVEQYLDGTLTEYSTDFRMRHKAGHWVWIRSRGILIRDENAEPARFVGAHTDISAEKRYESKLQEAMKKAEAATEAKSAFLAHMSHEIRTPLTAITGVAEILNQNAHDLDEKKQKLVKVLNDSAISLRDLISDILDFSKIDSGELELEEATFRLQDAFEHVTSIMSVRTKEKNLDFKFEYENIKNLEFYGDPVRIRQILINLVGNAVKFTESGHVHIKATMEDRDDYTILRVDVEDTGIGIPSNQIDTIFDRFKQADSTMSRKFGGTGLGLSISKKLAGLMGGSIEVESEFGKGSTFSLLIPFMGSASPSQEEKVLNEASKKKRIDELKTRIEKTHKALLVDDYEGNIAVIGYILEEMDIDYDIARTGLEAVNRWKENHYGLILMDIQMPEMDGFSSTSLIRSIEKEMDLRRIPIVGMTAHAHMGDKEKCIEAGMDAYLPKPIVEIDLKATILEYLSMDERV